MTRQGYDLELTRHDYATGMEHSPTGATGTGWERTPWHATQRPNFFVCSPLATRASES